MRHRGGEVEHWGEYVAIDRPSFLSFTWLSVNTDHLPTLVTVELLERDDSTELILTHRQLPASQVDSHRRGRMATVVVFEGALASGNTPFCHLRAPRPFRPSGPLLSSVEPWRRAP